MSTIVVSVIVALAALVGVTSYFFSGPDNKVEESCEKIIEQQTGTVVDLSPATPEVVAGPTASDIADEAIIEDLTK